MRSAKSLRRRHPADARCAPLRWNRSPDAFGGGAPAALPCLPPAGDFSPQKSPQNAPGAAAPGLPWGSAACIPRNGIARAVTLHRAVPPHTAHPFPASRGPVESEGRYGYRTFHSGRTDCPGNVGRILHTAAFARNLSVPAVDNAHCASECLRYQSASVERTRKRFPRRGRCLHRPAPRSGLLLQVRWLRIAVCIAAPLSSP